MSQNTAVVDFDRITIDGDELHAEAWLADGSIVELYRGDVMGGGKWHMDQFESRTVDWGFETIWTRPGKARDELAPILSHGLSAAKALDFWAVTMHGATASAWADKRAVSHQAVSENVRKAQQKLNE